MNAIVSEELEIRGSFRFHFEFPTAVEMMQKRLIAVAPLITQVFPFIDAVEAFDFASDRNFALKVQLEFGAG